MHSFSPVFYLNFKNLLQTISEWFYVCLELWIKKPSLLCLCFPAQPITSSYSPGPTGNTGKTNKQTNNKAAVWLMIGSKFCFDLFVTGSVPACLVHLFIVCLLILAIHFYYAHNVCQVGFKMLSLQGWTRLMRSLSARNLHSTQGRK